MKYPKVAQNIRYLRRAKELSREQLAELTGLTEYRIIQVECGEEPRAQELAMICAVLEVSEEQLSEDPQITAKRACIFLFDDI